MSGSSAGHGPAGRTLVASSTSRPTRRGRGWRGRLPGVLLVVVCVAGVTAAVTGAAGSLPGLQFLPGGHWVFNTVLQSAFHVDGGSAGVDAQVAVPGDAGSLVVQDDTSGYVVGRQRITQFGKSSLQVQRSTAAPADETPVAVETAGGPYLVYRNAGKVVRLGDPVTSVPTGGPVADPVATADGTLWLFRTSDGLVCSLPKDADRIASCPAVTPHGDAGALTVIGDRPHFLDLTSGELHPVGPGGFGPGVRLSVPVSPQSRTASTDVAGRVAVLDPHDSKLHLVDPAHPAAPAVTVPLPRGDYTGPTSTGAAVAVVDRSTGTVRTYTPDGRAKDSKELPDAGADPRLSRAEDGGVYVEGSQGTHVLVVDRDGGVVDVPVLPKQTGTGNTPHPDKPTRPDPDQHQPQQDRPKVPENPAPAPDQRSQHRTPQTKSTQPGDSSRPRAAKTVPPVRPAAPVVPASPPGAPGGVDASAGAGSATVTWSTAPANQARITGYTVSWRGGSSGSRTLGAGSRTATITGLTNGKRYTFSVSATNRAGRGPAASADPVVVGADPGAPTNVQVEITKNEVLVKWAAPNLNGGTLQGYSVSVTYNDGAGSSYKQSQSTKATIAPFGGFTTTGTGYAVATVRAVTVVGGQVRTGAAATARTNEVPGGGSGGGPTMTITQGDWSETDACNPPACAWVNLTMTGFKPNTTYQYTGWAAGGHWSGTYDITTDDNGSLVCNTEACPRHRWDVGGKEVYVYIVGPDGVQIYKSNTLIWKSR